MREVHQDGGGTIFVKFTPKRSTHGCILQDGELAAKSTEEWRADLDQGREELEMNMATNANVVDQYNRRKAEVSILGILPLALVDPWCADRRARC